MAWDYARRSSLRVRASAAAAVFLTIVLVWLGIGTANAAADAQSEVAELIEQASTLTFSSLLEPGTYAQLAEQSTTTQEALDGVEARLSIFRPFEFVPIVGGRVRSARNTVEVGNDLALAAGIILLAYGDALEERRTGGEVESSLASRLLSLQEAIDALDRAEGRAENDMVLSKREEGLLNAGIAVLRSLAVVAAETPLAVDDGFELLAAVDDLQDLVADPLRSLADTGAAKTLLATVRARASRLTEALSSVSGTSEETLQLALRGLGVINAAAEAAGELVAVADALEEGLFSEAFGAAVGPKLVAAQDHLDEAERLLALLREQFTGDLGEGIADVIADDPSGVFAPAEGALSETTELVQTMRSALGYESTQTYLLLMQNQAEIRATGGFIGATAEFPLTNGVLGPMVFKDSTRIDIPPLINNPPAPEPLYWYLWMGRLLFRDANWNPDFPHSAATLLDFYEESSPLTLDGAITGTKLLAFELVDVVGGIRVPELEGIVDRTSAELYAAGLLPYTCQNRHVSSSSKRCFDEDLLPAVVDGLRGGLGDTGRERLIELITRNLEQKNVLLFMRDSEVQELVLANGWGGAVGAPAQDLLMVVDSSLPGHTTSSVTREWDYRVTLVPGGTSRADLRIRFTNDRPIEVPDCRQAAEGGGGCYWNYVRAFLPEAASNVQVPSAGLHEGSEKLTWGHRDLETGGVLTHAGAGLTGLTEVGAYVVVEPLTVLTLPVSYELGPAVVRRVDSGRYEYRLQLLKQSGIDTDQVSVAVGLPAGSSVLATSPAGFVTSGDETSWRGALTSDTELVVVFEVPGEG